MQEWYSVRVLNSELQSQTIAGGKSSCPDARCVCGPWAVEGFVQEIQHDSSNLSMFSQLRVASYILHELILVSHFHGCDLQEAGSVRPWTCMLVLPCEFPGLFGSE
jgi:hypothetical protein